MSQLYEYFDVTGGGQTLDGYAFPDVHKFDASSFYNWEQDNLPILDLENRSNVLRQHLGLTDVTGVTLTVSADAPKSASSLGVYQTVQEALEVIPHRLRFPLLIEICDFGNLGDLSLHDIHCEGDGALQIVCRNFANNNFGASATAVSSSDKYGPQTTQTMLLGIEDFSGQVNNALSGDIQNASSTNIGVSCSSLEGWARNGRIFASTFFDSQKEVQNITFSPQYDNEVSDLFVGGALGSDQYTFTPYNETLEETISLDANPQAASYGNPLIASRRSAEANDFSRTSWWGAYFNKIEIRNCSRVKLQNICVDSASGLDTQYPNTMSYLCDTGLRITDSNVLLENIAICRVREEGINIQNSTVSFVRDLIVHRVYERNTDKTRPSEGIGIFAADSNLVFDTDGGSYFNGTALRTISKCGIGIHAINSFIGEGAISNNTNVPSCKNAGIDINIAGTDGRDLYTTRLYLHGNQTAIKLSNSVYDLNGRLEVFGNINGIEAYNSDLTFQQFSVDTNQEKGFYLNHSNLNYGKDADTLLTAVSGSEKPAFTCDHNGINLHADKNSSVGVHEGVSGSNNVELWGGKADRIGGTQGGGAYKWIMTNHGTYGLSLFKSPNILITNNSNAELTHLGVGFDGRAAGVPGACVQVKENSQAVFRGSYQKASCFGAYGTITLDNNCTVAAVAALDNSEVIFTGPTKIGRTGVGVLAQNNSRAAFGPPTLDYTVWTPAYNRFNLSSADNHTTVDIHANRACLVANERSTIDMKSLGGFSTDKPNSTDVNQSIDSSALFEESTSGSYVRFCPNGFTEQLVSSEYDPVGGTFNVFGRRAAVFGANGHVSATTGGMCVRAVGASKVDVNMVNFKVGDGLSEHLSGVCYNYNGSGSEFDDTTTLGIAASPTFNICDLVTDCCEQTTTVDSGTTTTTTAPTTSTVTTVTGTVEPPPLEPPTETWNVNIYAPLANMGDEGNNVQDSNFSGVNYEFSGVGSRIHMWNIADTSRFHAANLYLNGEDPVNNCVNNAFHGPTGRWPNGAACDYYGKYGFAASTLSEAGIAPSKQINGFYNLGVFRVVGSHRGYLKTYSEIDYHGLAINSQMTNGGSPMDQVNSQGYQSMFDLATNTSGVEDTVSFHVGLEPGMVSGVEPVFGRGLAGVPGEPGKVNGVMTHARMVEGEGMKWDEGELHPIFPFPPLHLGWQGYIRNWLDESAASVFSNARHSASKKVNLLSIYRSSTDPTIGGEGRDAATGSPTFGLGVRSLNMFDLNRLV